MVHCKHVMVPLPVEMAREVSQAPVQCRAGRARLSRSTGKSGSSTLNGSLGRRSTVRSFCSPAVLSIKNITQLGVSGANNRKNRLVRAFACARAVVRSTFFVQVRL